MVGSPEWCNLAEKVEVMSLDARDEMVRFVAEQREPVNVGMKKEGFDVSAMQRVFGWSKSGYRVAFERDQSKLPPNIALYMQTPMVHADGPVAHVINAVGFAFDSEEQPDYKYFIIGGREAELLNRLRDVFLLVFACAARHQLPTVVLSLLGGGAFSEIFPGGPKRYTRLYFMPALKAAIDSLCPAARPSRLGMMGKPDTDVMAGLRQVSGGIPCEAYGFVPSICGEPGVAETLFMNAWDPHSIVGNGNASDNSLDGFFGRSSAMAYLSFPSVNPFFRQVHPSDIAMYFKTDTREFDKRHIQLLSCS